MKNPIFVEFEKILKTISFDIPDEKSSFDFIVAASCSFELPATGSSSLTLTLSLSPSCSAFPVLESDVFPPAVNPSMPILTSSISGLPCTNKSPPARLSKSSLGLPIVPGVPFELPESFRGLPRFRFGWRRALPSSGFIIWLNRLNGCWPIRCRCGGGFVAPPCCCDWDDCVCWGWSSDDVMLGMSHFSSFTSVKPFMRKLSATRKNAVSLSWSTLTSPRYMKSSKLLISEYGTSFRMTMGCLSGWLTKSAWKYGLHALRTILCARSNCPSTARVTSTKLSSCRSWSKTDNRFDWWLFHRRQNLWEDILTLWLYREITTICFYHGWLASYCNWFDTLKT